MPASRRLATLLAAVLATAGLSACGRHPDEHARIVRAKTEGLYLVIGELKYQIQVSRTMNPYDTQDKPLLGGVPAAQAKLAPDDVWFAVFMRVQNETSKQQLPSSEIEIRDTEGHVFKPLGLASSNVFAYRSTVAVPAGAVSPLPDSPAFDIPARGNLLLFKLKNSTLDNRPLELHIVSRSPQQTGIIDLDV